MPRNKLRLHLALYSRPKHPGTYHYAFLIAPKSNKGLISKHHVKNTLHLDEAGELIQPWRYEQFVVTDVAAERGLLVRVIIAKVVQTSDHVQQILENMPVHQVDIADPARTRSFDCRTWVRDAFQELTTQGAVTGKLEKWEDVERQALEYLDKKRSQKRWDDTWNGRPGVPLMDLLEGSEIVA